MRSTARYASNNQQVGSERFTCQARSANHPDAKSFPQVMGKLSQLPVPDAEHKVTLCQGLQVLPVKAFTSKKNAIAKQDARRKKSKVVFKLLCCGTT